MAAFTWLAWGVAASLAAPGDVPLDHPRLLINRADVAAIRARCGLGGSPPAGERAGEKNAPPSQRWVLERVRKAARSIMAGPAGPDDLFTPALLHALTGDWVLPDEYSRYIVDSLLDPHRNRFDLDALVALDWCWDAMSVETRQRILARLPPASGRLDNQVSPVDHLTFYSRLCSLAQAIVCEDPAASPRDREDWARLRSDACAYLTGPFVNFCRLRGVVPTSGANGIWEEADCVLAVELLRSGLGRDIWPELCESLGRCLEHYFYADTEHPALPHGFIHDDGTHSPARPGQVYRGFVPAVPFVLARHARDPVATWYAARSLPRLEPPLPDLERFAWIRLVYGPADGPEAARRACPLGRDFGGGWVAMRTGWRSGDAVLLFDVGQPFWRSRQHFDAGHFLIYGKGRLTQQSGDDVTYEAVPSKQGRTFLGDQPGDWDQYFQSTIAHNCVTVADPARIDRLQQRPWAAMGNQRLLIRDYMPAEGALAQTGRQTGSLLAFQTNSFFTHAVADLSAAHPRETVQQFTREILMLSSGIVLILDRMSATQNRSVKTWHLQLPGKPALETRTATAPADDGFGPAVKQLFGVQRDAGIWELPQEQDWLSTGHGEGVLWVRTLLPQRAHRRLVGGPMKMDRIPAGPFAGRPYCGGDPGSFEYRLCPAMILKGPAASYQLGNPTHLGDQFGAGSTWGRYDVSPRDRVTNTVFLHVLFLGTLSQQALPAVALHLEGATVHVQIALASKEEVGFTADTKNPVPSRLTIRSASSETLIKTELVYKVALSTPVPATRSNPSE